MFLHSIHLRFKYIFLFILTDFYLNDIFIAGLLHVIVCLLCHISECAPVKCPRTSSSTPYIITRSTLVFLSLTL